MLHKNDLKSASAAVPVNESTYTGTFLGQHAAYISGSNRNHTFSDFGAVNSSYGSVAFNNGIATISKATGRHHLAAYISFEAEITVPALTEYKVTYSYTHNLSRGAATSGSTSEMHSELFYYGNSAEGGSDLSSTITYKYNNVKSSSYTVSLLYTQGKQYDSRSGSGSIPTITYTNNTNSDQTFTAYFGLYAMGGYASSGYDNYMNTAASVTENVEVTSVAVPTVDKTTTSYDGTNQEFKYTYDTDRIDFIKAEYVPVGGAAQSLYEYDVASGSVVSGNNPLNASGVMQAKEAGTYKLYFDIKPDCGAVWDSATNDQTTKIVQFTITPKQLTIPSITAPQEYTGSALTYVLTDFDSGTNISVDGVSGAKGNAATGAGGAAVTDTTDTFEATNVDVYSVTLSLRDTKNYCWTDATTAAKTVKFEVTQKELLSTAPVSSKVNNIGGAEWAFGDNSVTVTITDNRISGETVNLLCYYDVTGGTDKSKTLTATTTGNTTVITMPDNIAVGKYTLTVELNGSTGDNANYKITKNNTLDFEITSGKIDPSKYGWIYTKDGAAGATISSGVKLPFTLKSGSAVDGVKYEVSIQIPSTDSFVVVDTSKYASGYQLRSGDKVGTYKTVVALKSTDSAFMFEDGLGNKSATTEVEFNWEIEKGTFDLSGVKWEYTLDNGTSWTEYDSANPPQYNDGNYITVRIKANSLPLGLNLDALYMGMDEYDVDTYTATVSASDLVYNNSNFNTPDVSSLKLNWEIAKKNLYAGFKNVKETYSNSNGSGTIIIKQLNVDAKYEPYITYKYYDATTGVEVTLAEIKAAADPTNEKKYKVEAYIDPAYSSSFVLDDNGSTPNDSFVTGSKNKLATVTIGGNDGTSPIKAEYDKNTHFDPSIIKITGEDGINVTDYTVTYYRGNTPKAGNELAAGELPKDAGEYCIAVTLGATAEKKYILATDWFPVTVEAKGIDIPTFGGITFNGSEQNFTDHLSGSWADYKDIIELGGMLSERNVGSGDYVTTLTLKDGNYKWLYPTTVTPAGFSLTAGSSVTGDEVTATYNWNIAPLVVDTTSLWNKGNKGASLNLPQSVKDLIAAGTLELGYRYYDTEGNFVESPEIKGGKSFKVEAVFGGDDSVRNVQFKTGETTLGNTSPAINYTVPQSGAAAFFGNALSFLKSNWLWFLIGFLVLLFLIILIVVIAKRRKNKEEREAKKEAKAEEKRRREEEREAEKERRNAELELAKAKQEAELAKMKAEAAAAAGIGAAGVAMTAQPQQVQQQPIQQPVQQVQQQPYPQYNTDPNVLAEIKAELAEIKARQNMDLQQYRQPTVMPMQMPMQQPIMQMPMQMPMPNYGPMQSYGGQGGGNNMNDPVMFAEITRLKAENEAHMKSELDRARTESERAKADAEIAKIRAESGQYAPRMQTVIPERNYQVQPQTDAQRSISAEELGSIIGGVLKELNVPVEKRTSPKITVEEQTKPATVESPTVYPADAVVTTTTTVDTTKNKTAPRSLRSDDGRLFDIDGFYDTFEGK